MSGLVLALTVIGCVLFAYGWGWVTGFACGRGGRALESRIGSVRVVEPLSIPDDELGDDPDALDGALITYIEHGQERADESGR